jgi:metallo-beta-lactamase family protein
VLGGEKRDDSRPGHVPAEIGHQVPEVVFFLRADRAVGQEYERPISREPPDGMVGIDPRVHAFAGAQLGPWRAEFSAKHPSARAQLGQKVSGHRWTTLYNAPCDGLSRVSWRRRDGDRLVIPSFAIGRVEEVLYWLKRLEEARRIPVLPVYIDSPMAAGALAFYKDRLSELDADMQSPVTRDLCAFCTERMVTVSSPQESKELVASNQPAIVIASSGMATGGRVLHHLAASLPDPRNTILFVGYQAAGTRGRHLCDGARQVKLHGQFVPVAARIERIDSMSAHADADEIMRWLSGFSRPPAMTYLVHGEPGALDALGARISREHGWAVHIAKYLERVSLPLDQ